MIERGGGYVGREEKLQLAVVFPCCKLIAKFIRVLASICVPSD